MSTNRIFNILVSLMVFTGCNLQHSLLYYPDLSLPSPEELAVGNIRFWPSGPSDYRGFISAPPATKEVKGTVIVFHGNAGTAADRTYYTTALAHLGFRVLLAEYPGYGARQGELGETSFVNDAQTTVRLVSERYGGAPIFLLGESLGCGVAAGVVKGVHARIKIAGVLCITPWDTLWNVARSKFPLLPLSLFMKDRYDNSKNLQGYQGHIAIVGAERDEVIPVKHAQALHDSLSGRKRIWLIKGAGHNDWPVRVGGSLWRELMDFISSRDDAGAGQ